MLGSSCLGLVWALTLVRRTWARLMLCASAPEMSTAKGYLGHQRRPSVEVEESQNKGSQGLASRFDSGSRHILDHLLPPLDFSLSFYRRVSIVCFYPSQG